MNVFCNKMGMELSKRCTDGSIEYIYCAYCKHFGTARTPNTRSTNGQNSPHLAVPAAQNPTAVLLHQCGTPNYCDYGSIRSIYRISKYCEYSQYPAVHKAPKQYCEYTECLTEVFSLGKNHITPRPHVLRASIQWLTGSDWLRVRVATHS